jgi:renalase
VSNDLGSPVESVAVIGAGMAGITCAVTLALRVDTVVVFEAERQAGGRMAGERHGGFEHDTGAQYFTVRDLRFQRHVETWRADGLVSPWCGWLVELERGDLAARDHDRDLYVAVPNMAALVRDLARLCELRYAQAVGRLRPLARGWALYDGKGRMLGRFDLVVLALPPDQVRALAGRFGGELSEVLEGVAMSACWGLALGFDEPLAVPFDAALVSASPLAWVARNSSKPGRAAREAWMVHATPEWSERHRHDSPDLASAHLLAAFGEALGVPIPRPSLSRARCWPQAVVVDPAGRDCVLDEVLRLGACGDWCLGPRVEAAFISGLAMAERVAPLCADPAS